MKLAVGAFIEGVMAAKAGANAGRAAAAQEIQRRQAQEFAQQSQAFTQRLTTVRAAGDAWSNQQRQRIAGRNQLGKQLLDLAQAQGLDPQARDAFVRQGMAQLDEAAALGETPNPYGPEALQRLLDSTPLGRRIRDGQPAFGTTASGPTMAQRQPLSLPPVDRPLFRTPVSKAIADPIRTAADRARLQGMGDRYGKLQQLLVDLDGGKITGESAWEAFREIGLTPELEPVRKWTAEAGQRIAGLVKGNTLTPQAQDTARELQAELEGAGSAFPPDPAALELARSRYLAFLRNPTHFRPDGRQQFLELQAKLRAEEQKAQLGQSAHSRNSAYLAGIAAALRAGNVAQFRELVGQQRAFVGSQPVEFGLRPYGGDELDPVKRRPVTRRTPGTGETLETPETDEEAAGRALREAGRFVDTPEAKKALARGAREELMRAFRPDRWEALEPAERRSLLQQLADLGEEIGVPGVVPQGLTNRLTPYERAFVENRTGAQKEAQRHAAELQSLAATVERKRNTGELRPVMANVAALLVEELEQQGQALATLQRIHPEERTGAQRKQLARLTGEAGGVGQLRSAVHKLLNPEGRSWPPIPKVWNPALKEQRKRALTRYKTRFGEPAADTLRELYYLVETGLLRMSGADR
jgi:hypothetical protein